MSYQNLEPFQTLTDSVKQVCTLVGHPLPGDVASSSDPAVQQMISACNLANQELMALEEWQEMIKTMSIQVVDNGTGDKTQFFDLPEDFLGWVDQTQWNKTTRLPAIGPVSQQGWIAYTVRTALPQLTIFWQMDKNRLAVINPPPVGSPYEFVAKYVSSACVQDESDPSLYKGMALKNGDAWLLPGILVTLLARVKYLSFKGFDTSAAMSDYQTAYETRVRKTRGAPVLSVSRVQQFPYLGWGNIPDTNYGMPP
jgi:hypothetical protein